jgi:hypothetical protein
LCFSATANFVASGVLGAIGIATIKEVKHRRELLFASIPCLLAPHQFTEAFVWLGLDSGPESLMAHNAGAAYILYAQGLLPAPLPLAVLLIEPTQPRRRRMTAFAVLGFVLAVYMLWGLIAYPLEISAAGHSIIYLNAITTTTLVAVLYVVATCGALFFSGFRGLIPLGGVNLGGLLLVMAIRRYVFTSIWWAYAAVVSVIIYFFFRQSRAVRPAICLYARNDSGVDDNFDKGSEVFLPLADGLIVEDCASNAFPETGRGND